MATKGLRNILISALIVLLLVAAAIGVHLWDTARKNREVQTVLPSAVATKRRRR